MSDKTEAGFIKDRLAMYENKIRGPQHDPKDDRQDFAILDMARTATEGMERWIKRCEAQEQAIARLRRRLKDAGLPDA